jgi:hypothetical protein
MSGRNSDAQQPNRTRLRVSRAVSLYGQLEAAHSKRSLKSTDYPFYAALLVCIGQVQIRSDNNKCDLKFQIDAAIAIEIACYNGSD